MAAQVLAVVRATIAGQAGGPYDVEYETPVNGAVLAPTYVRVSSMQAGCAGDVVCLVPQALLAGLVNGQTCSITISYGAGTLSGVAVSQ